MPVRRWRTWPAGRAGLSPDQHLHAKGATGSRRRSSPTRSGTSCCRRTRFVPLQGTLDDYHLYVLLAPHLGNRGAGNTAWVGDYKGIPMLLRRARRRGRAGAGLLGAVAAPLGRLRRRLGWLAGSQAPIGR